MTTQKNKTDFFKNANLTATAFGKWQKRLCENKMYATPEFEALVEESPEYIRTQLKDVEFQTAHSFQPIAPEQLIALRKEAIAKRYPLAIIKLDGEYYYCRTLKQYNSIFSKFHLCSNCARCVALPSKEGGCDKVTRLTLSGSFYVDSDNNFHRFNFEGSKRMEVFDFITAGIEEVGRYTEKDNSKVLKCKGHAFHIFNCKDFIPMDVNPKKSNFNL